MTKIFISHATADDAFVNLLANELSIAGFTTWIDHQDMPPGVNWVSYLEKMLKECDLMILVCSNTSIASSYVQSEWHSFFSMGKKIIPLVIETCPIPEFLKTVHQIDFRKGWCWNENVNTLIKFLMEYVKDTLFDNKVQEVSENDPTPTTPPSDILSVDEVTRITNSIFDDIAPTYKLGMLYLASPYEKMIYPYPRRKSYIIGRTHKMSRHTPDIEIPHGKYTGLISRKHARLVYKGKQLTIQDLGSTNGTYLNGEKLKPKKRYRVHSHDIIQLSQYVPFAIRFML